MGVNQTNWEDLGISNDFLFGKVMQNPRLCQELLKRILPDLKIDHIEYPELQKAIKPDADAKSIRLDVYVKDKFNLGVQDYFEKQNPAALEEMTAVMMETIRKGMWQASGQQIADIAKLHTDLVNKYKPSCSGFVCDNAKLRQFIASKTDAQTASRYKENISQIREVAASKEQKGMVMKKEEMNTVGTEQQTNTVSNTVVCVVVVAAVLVLIVLVRCRRKKMQE